nr:MAG TPA_asm: hypothetical protein [Caudoviricetes sp.]
MKREFAITIEHRTLLVFRKMNFFTELTHHYRTVCYDSHMTQYKPSLVKELWRA